MVGCVSYSPMYPYNAKSICIGRSHCVRETFCVSCLVYSRVSGIKKYLMYFILIVIFKGYISCHTSSCLKCAGGALKAFYCKNVKVSTFLASSCTPYISAAYINTGTTWAFPI